MLWPSAPTVQQNDEVDGLPHDKAATWGPGTIAAIIGIRSRVSRDLVNRNIIPFFGANSRAAPQITPDRRKNIPCPP
jgi:hypothetical protein